MDYIFVQAFRHYQHGKLESRMEHFTSFRQFQMERRRGNSYRSYLFKLKEELTPSSLEMYFPGLRQQIDLMKGGPATRNAAREEDEHALGTTATAASAVPPLEAPSKMKALYDFVNPENPLSASRLDVSLNHIKRRSDKKKKVVKKDGTVEYRRERGRCILCCEHCDEHVKTPKANCKTRSGRKSVWYCGACEVYLCNHCWESFHTDDVPNLPPCIENKMGLAHRKVLRYNADKAQKKSPVRAVRETRSRKCSPSKGSASARAIGKKLLKRTADKPDALMAETPVQAQDSPMVARRSTNNKKVVLPRILSVWRPGQPVPGRSVVRGTEVMASISRKRSRKNLRASDKKASNKKPTKRGKGTKSAKSGANKKSQTARMK